MSGMLLFLLFIRMCIFTVFAESIIYSGLDVPKQVMKGKIITAGLTARCDKPVGVVIFTIRMTNGFEYKECKVNDGSSGYIVNCCDNNEVNITYINPVTEDLETLGLGEKIGDLNADGRLDIDDATEMQRCLAEFCDYPADDGVEADGWQRLGGKPLAYRSDVNGDGMRSISDVTAAQRILAGITE